MSMGENAENGTGGSQNNFAQYDGQAIDRLNAFGLLSGDEKTELAKMALPRRTVERGEAIREIGKESASLFLLLEGWAASAITFPDASRQLTSVSLPGDLLGLPSLSVVEPIDTLLALSKVVVCDIPAANFAEMFTNMPRLATTRALRPGTGRSPHELLSAPNTGRDRRSHRHQRGACECGAQAGTRKKHHVDPQPRTAHSRFQRSGGDCRCPAMAAG